MCLGIAGVRRFRTERWPRFLVVGLHRNLTLLAVAFVALHVVTTVADGFAPIGLKDAVIPFASPYRPIWLGLGHGRVRPPARARRSRASCAPASAIARGAPCTGARTPRGRSRSCTRFGTGSDARVGWMQVLGVVSAAVVVAAVLARLADGPRWTGARSLAAAAALLLVPVGMLGWYVTGPGRPGWAARSGTPGRLLPQPAAAVSADGRRRRRRARRGHASRRRRSPRRCAGACPRRRIRTASCSSSIRGRTRRPAARRAVDPAAGPADRRRRGLHDRERRQLRPRRRCRSSTSGKIVSLSGTRLVARAARQRRATLALHVDLRINGLSHVVTGTVAARTASADGEPCAVRPRPRRRRAPRRLLGGLRSDGGGARLRGARPPLRPAPAACTSRHAFADLVAESGLRGRGGGGLPDRRQADRRAGGRGRPVVVANGAEGEPPSAKDKVLLALRAASRARRRRARGTRRRARRRRSWPSGQPFTAGVERAISDRSGQRPRRRRCRRIAVPERFVAGEETALVQFINGGPALPTFTPPRPFERGVGGGPTLVQNVETLAHLALVARFGPEWFRAVGTAAEPGTALRHALGRVPPPRRLRGAVRSAADRHPRGSRRRGLGTPGLAHRRSLRHLDRPLPRPRAATLSAAGWRRSARRPAHARSSRSRRRPAASPRRRASLATSPTRARGSAGPACTASTRSRANSSRSPTAASAARPRPHAQAARLDHRPRRLPASGWRGAADRAARCASSQASSTTTSGCNRCTGDGRAVVPVPARRMLAIPMSGSVAARRPDHVRRARDLRRALPGADLARRVGLPDHRSRAASAAGSSGTHGGRSPDARRPPSCSTRTTRAGDGSDGRDALCADAAAGAARARRDPARWRRGRRRCRRRWPATSPTRRRRRPMFAGLIVAAPPPATVASWT